MNEKTESIRTVVSDTENQPVPAKRLRQYLATLAITPGALAAGFTLAWSSSAGPDGKDLASEYNIPISIGEFSWIGSLATLGSAAICIPIGFLLDWIGRKYSMLLIIVPVIVGWLFIIFANSVFMFYIGRFITGVSAGAFCIVAPIYTAEIAESEIRGVLGIYFQLSLALGILISYIMGAFVTMKTLSIVSAVVPFVLVGVILVMPETPTYYLKNGNDEAARKSLIKLRGARYDVDTELRMKKEGLAELSSKSVSWSDMIKSKAVMKGFVIANGLMIFQQFSGVNIIIFYSNDIFAKAGGSLRYNYFTIIVGAMKVLTIFIGTVVIDRLGRRKLLLASITLLCLTTFTLGVYFYLQQIQQDVSGISWLPVVCVCLFLCAFALGIGPIPWLILGEVFAPEVKGVAASIAGVLSWILAFVVTKFYSDLKEAMNISGTFWFYSATCIVGFFFIYFLMPETKGKSLEQIQKDLATTNW